MYKCSRRFRRIGLSGYRTFNTHHANETATKKMCLMIFFQIRGEAEILKLFSMTGLRCATVQIMWDRSCTHVPWMFKEQNGTVYDYTSALDTARLVPFEKKSY